MLKDGSLKCPISSNISALNISCLFFFFLLNNLSRTFLQVAAVLALIFGFLYFRRFHDLVPNRSGFDPLKLLIRRRFQTLSSAWFFEGMDKEMRGLVSAKTHTPEEAMVQLMCNELETATAELIVLRGALPPQMLQQTALTIPAP